MTMLAYPWCLVRFIQGKLLVINTPQPSLKGLHPSATSLMLLHQSQLQWRLAVKYLQALGEDTIPPPAIPIFSSKVQVLKQGFGRSDLKKWVPYPHSHTVNCMHLADFSCKESEECQASSTVLWVMKESSGSLSWSPVLQENPFPAKNPKQNQWE